MITQIVHFHTLNWFLHTAYKS